MGKSTESQSIPNWKGRLEKQRILSKVLEAFAR
jgi:hypothetical protein